MRIPVVLLLLKSYLKGTKPLRSVTQRFSFGKKKSVRTISGVVLSLLMLASLMSFVFLLGTNYYNYQLVGMMVGVPHVGLLMGAAFATLSLLIFAFPAAINILHAAKEIERLRALAISESELALSRMIIFYFNFFPIYLFFVIPALIVGIMTTGFSFFYLLSSLLLLLVGPMIPISLVSLLEVGVVHLTKGRRAQRSGELFYLVVMMALVIGISSQMGKNAEMTGNLEELTHQLAPVIKKLTRFLAPFALQAQGLYNPILLLVWLAGALLLAYITFTVTAGTYHHACSLLASGGYRTKKRRKNNTGEQKPIVALMKRDWTILLSTSGFIFELGGELLIPLILIITYTAMGIIGDISQATKVLAQYPIFEPVVVLIVLLMSNINLLSCTSVSRQGKLALHDRLYPLEPKIFVNAKFYLHMALVGTTNTIYLLAATLILKLSIGNLWFYVMLSLISIAGTSYFHLAIDYHNPLLEWTSAQQAMKRNPNGFLGMLVSFLFVVWVALFLVGLPYFFKISQSNALMVALGMAVVTAKAGQRLAYRSAKGFLA
jgi:ABC-2 type transport system permease protein